MLLYQTDNFQHLLSSFAHKGITGKFHQSIRNKKSINVDVHELNLQYFTGVIYPCILHLNNNIKQIIISISISIYIYIYIYIYTS